MECVLLNLGLQTVNGGKWEVDWVTAEMLQLVVPTLRQETGIISGCWKLLNVWAPCCLPLKNGLREEGFADSSYSISPWIWFPPQKVPVYSLPCTAGLQLLVISVHQIPSRRNLLAHSWNTFRTLKPSANPVGFGSGPVSSLSRQPAEPKHDKMGLNGSLDCSPPPTTTKKNNNPSLCSD